MNTIDPATAAVLDAIRRILNPTPEELAAVAADRARRLAAAADAADAARRCYVAAPTAAKRRASRRAIRRVHFIF